MTKRLNLEPLFELYGLFHGGRTRRFCELDLLTIILIENMEKFRFVPGTHIKILIHVEVLLPQFKPIFLWEVRNLAGVDL